MPEQNSPDQKSVTRGLATARNPAQRMQELLRKSVTTPAAQEDAEKLDVMTTALTPPVISEEQASAANETPTAGDTSNTTNGDENNSAYLNTQVSNQVSKESLKSSGTQANGEVRKQVRAPVSKQPPKKATERIETVPDAHAGIRTRLQSQSGKEANVRLSVDVSETLHMRIKQYCAMHRIPSSRMLIIALLEDYLEGEGY